MYLSFPLSFSEEFGRRFLERGLIAAISNGRRNGSQEIVEVDFGSKYSFYFVIILCRVRELRLLHRSRTILSLNEIIQPR